MRDLKNYSLAIGATNNIDKQGKGYFMIHLCKSKWNYFLVIKVKELFVFL